MGCMSPYIVAGVAVVALLVFIALAYRLHWQWTGLPAPRADDEGSGRSAKTLWDWLQLLVIPLALAALAFLLNNAQALREQDREDERAASQAARAQVAAREDTLRTYLAQMSDLMLNHKLLDATPRSPVHRVARTATRTAVRRLDAERNEIVVRLLAEADLLAGALWFRRADLRRADLSHEDLHRANLTEANLRGADLSGANLRGAHLSGRALPGGDRPGADLSGASLFGAHLNDAHLGRANLRGANLGDADLGGADLGGADLRRTDLAGRACSGQTSSGRTSARRTSTRRTSTGRTSTRRT